jgi:hypothetical protein
MRSYFLGNTQLRYKGQWAPDIQDNNLVETEITTARENGLPETHRPEAFRPAV